MLEADERAGSEGELPYRVAGGRMRTERSKERGSGEREEDEEDASREESMIMVCMDWSGQVVYTEAGRAQRLNSHSHSASDNRQPSL